MPSDRRVIAATRSAGAPLAATRSLRRSTLVVGDRTVRLISLGGPATDRLLTRVAADIGAAVEHVEAFWGADWSRDITVVAAGTDEQFRGAAGGGPASQWADIAAVTVADRVDPVRRVAVGQRIVFAPGAAGMSAAALRIVLTPRAFSLCRARRHRAGRASVADRRGRRLRRPAATPPVPAPTTLADPSLPSDADLDTPGPQRSLAYDRAWWFARFVADTYGTPKLRALYLAACGVGHADPFATAVARRAGHRHGGRCSRAGAQWTGRLA